MRAVMMDQDSRRIDAVMGISTEVVAAVHHHAFPPGGGQALGDHQSGEARADDQKVGGAVRFQRLVKEGCGPATLPPLVDLSVEEGNLGEGGGWWLVLSSWRVIPRQ